MMDSSRSQAISALIPPPLRRLARAAQYTGGAASSVKFTDVLAESKAPIIRREGESASSEQMFDATIQNTRDRRKAELRHDYREGVDRRSASRAQERTGVKARRSQTTEHESAIDGLAPMPVNDLAKRSSASVRQEVGVPEAMLKKSTLPEKSTGKVEAMQNSVEPQQRGDGREGSGDKEHQPPIALTTPTQSRPIGSAPAPFASDPQAAKELARLLATPTAMNSGRDTTSMQSVVAGRSGQSSAPETKDAKGTESSTDSPRTSTAPSKSPQSSTVTEFERLIRLVRAQSGRQSSTRVLLDPPELGRVHVRVIVEGDRVEVGVETENDSARQLISERAAKLKTALEQHGLVIDRFDVTTNQTGLFEQRFLVGQEPLRPRQDQNGSGNGRGFSARPRGAPSDIQAAPAVDSVNAGWHNDKGIDIQV